MNMRKTIGKNIQAARKEKKLGQKDVAAHIGVTVQAISMWERGDNSMNADTFVAICDFLGVSTDTIAGRIPQGITPSEMDMLRKFREIDRTQQEMILSSLETAYAVTKKGNVSAYVTA